ncbi:hypothetical protein WR25_01061 [Diploscapter pachys]|uniref:G-protein coupled receptors family 1 profile domain-containing protein n=1 Tax=Diploscapter pachys TaxID=2018661 RepID=A0A2A2JT51_9BILA|nr:hypothetical protein WR25_01061 [Diploscapter pachys]
MVSFRHFPERLDRLHEPDVLQKVLSRCQTQQCMINTIRLLMSNATMRNCSYRYPAEDAITPFALWIDTMLVIYISVLRFLVVLRPLRYANYVNSGRGQRNSGKNRKASSIPNEESIISVVASPRAFSVVASKGRISIKKILRPFLWPVLVIALCFTINIPVFFEFEMEKCWEINQQIEAMHPVPTEFRYMFQKYKVVLMMLTQTIGPVGIILLFTLLTEYHIHKSLQARKKLFESQQRSRSQVLSEELKERVSRTVAIFIAVKFLIMRSMPVFFDIYENLYGIKEFGWRISVAVRVSDFLIVLNSATNSLAYFGKKRWLEKRLRLHLLKKEEKRQLKQGSSRKNTSCQEKRLSTQVSNSPGNSMSASGRRGLAGRFNSIAEQVDCTPLVSSNSTPPPASPSYV